MLEQNQQESERGAKATAAQGPARTLLERIRQDGDMNVAVEPDTLFDPLPPDPTPKPIAAKGPADEGIPLRQAIPPVGTVFSDIGLPGKSAKEPDPRHHKSRQTGKDIEITR